MRISDIFAGISEPPPTAAECNATAVGAQARAVCAQLQDPAVWRREEQEDGFPPVPMAP